MKNIIKKWLGIEDNVKCNTCKCWLSREDAQIVKVEENISLYPISISTLYYCQIHKKPYDRVYRNFWGKEVFYKEGGYQVNEDGTDIGVCGDTLPSGVPFKANPKKQKKIK